MVTVIHPNGGQAQLPLYVFGTPEKEAHIRRIRGVDCRFRCHEDYVVMHPGVRGGETFYTLNSAREGQVVPAMKDLAVGPGGVLVVIPAETRARH